MEETLDEDALKRLWASKQQDQQQQLEQKSVSSATGASDVEDDTAAEEQVWHSAIEEIVRDLDLRKAFSGDASESLKPPPADQLGQQIRLALWDYVAKNATDQEQLIDDVVTVLADIDSPDSGSVRTPTSARPPSPPPQQSGIPTAPPPPQPPPPPRGL